MQLQRETVERIDAALTRLDHRLYGCCTEVEMTSPPLGCGRCHSPFAAWTARRRAKPTPRDAGLRDAGQRCSGKRRFDSGEHMGSLGDDSARAYVGGNPLQCPTLRANLTFAREIDMYAHRISAVRLRIHSWRCSIFARQAPARSTCDRARAWRRRRTRSPRR